MRKRIKKTHILLTGILLLSSNIWGGCEQKRKEKTTYSVEGTAFTPTVKWMSDKVYRVYLQSKDFPDADDYIELRSTEPMGDALCTTYNRLLIFYNEKNPRDIYTYVSEDKTLLKVKSDYYNVFHHEPQTQGEHVSNGQLISYGEKKLPRSLSPQFSDSLYIHTQYHWVFTDGNRKISVYFDGKEIDYTETTD